LKELREGIGPAMEFEARERIRKDLERAEEEKMGVRGDESDWEVTVREDSDRLNRLEGSDCPNFVFAVNVRVVRFVDETNISSGIGPVRPVDCSAIDCNEGRESKPTGTWPLGIFESPMIDKLCRPMSEDRLLGNVAGTPGKTRDIEVILPSASQPNPFHKQ